MAGGDVVVGGTDRGEGHDRVERQAGTGEDGVAAPDMLVDR